MAKALHRYEHGAQNKSHGFEKEIFKLINYSVFGKTMEHARKHRDIKISSSNTA